MVRELRGVQILNCYFSIAVIVNRGRGPVAIDALVVMNTH
jgi:hypothetical protein